MGFIRGRSCPPGQARRAPGSTSASHLKQLLTWVCTRSTASLPLAFPENTTSKGPTPRLQKASVPGPHPGVSSISKSVLGHPGGGGSGTILHLGVKPKDRGEKALALAEPHLGTACTGWGPRHLSYLGSIPCDPEDVLINE